MKNNIKLNIILIAILVTITVSAFAGAGDQIFLADFFHPKSLIVAFTAEAVNNKSGKINYTIVDGAVNTQIKSLNQIAAAHKIIAMEQLHDFVAYPEWNDNGVYLQNIYRLTLAENENIREALFALKKDKSIVFAEYESIVKSLYTPNDPEYHLQWHHPVIKSNEAWNYVRGSREVIVAITDTGTKWNHPDLADNIWINEAELPNITINWTTGQIYGGDGIDNDGNGKIDDIMGWDFVENNNNPYQNYPGNEHGTHVAGCAGAVGDNNIGVTGSAMVVSLLNCKGASSYSSGSGVQYAYNQVQYSAESGAHIINCSWISYGYDGNYSNSVVNYATNLGSLVIAGAGNANTQHTSSLQAYPSDATNSLSVAATDSNDIKASFSDYGNPIDLAAPGVNIRSTYSNDGYNSSSGTSMASPVAAGVAALVKALHPTITPVNLKNRLKNTTDYIDDINPNYAGLLGTGRINSFKATMFDKIPNLSIFEKMYLEHSGDGDGVANPGEEVNVYLSIFNENGWTTATGVTAVLSTSVEGVTILTGTAQYPNIFSGSIVVNSNQPLRFVTEETFSDLTIPFEVTLSSNAGSSYPYQKTFQIEIELTLQKAGWPLELTGTSSSSALIYDVNNNGANEIIFGDTQGNLHIITGDKNYINGFPVNLGGNISTAVAAADINNNGFTEIVANTQTGSIVGVSHNGTILFEYNAGGQLRTNPMIVDVDNDGTYEIVAITFNSPKLIILNSDGTDYQNFPVTLPAGTICSPAAADLNGDGYQEIVFVSTNGELNAVSPSTTENVFGFPVALGSSSWNGPIVSDINGNGHPEIIVATVQGMLYGINRHGNEFFSRNIGSGVRTSVVAADLDSDGSIEIVFADMTGRVFVTDGYGNDINGFPVQVTSASIESTPILADMTLDGNYEIIFGDTNGYLHSIDLNGDETLNFPIFLGTALNTSPAMGFVDSNFSHPAILIPNSYGYNYIDFKREIGAMGWQFFRYDARRSGATEVFTNIEASVSLYQTKLKGNFPNPFNPITNIVFEIEKPSQVNLSIYNIRGQLVRKLIDNELYTAGEKEVLWDGKNDKGQQIGTGIYFYRFEADKYSSVKRMILLK